MIINQWTPVSWNNAIFLETVLRTWGKWFFILPVNWTFLNCEMRPNLNFESDETIPKFLPKNHIQPKEDMNNQNLQITWSIKKLTPRFSDIDMKIWKFIRTNSFLIRGRTSFILFPFSLHQPPSRGEHNSLVLNRDEHLTLAFCFKNSVHNEITAIAFIIIQK